MSAIPAPSAAPSEEWPDADFDIPEDQPFNAKAEEDDDEDWDVAFDLGKTGGAKMAFASSSSTIQPVQFSSNAGITIRPRIPTASDLEDESDEGVSTIKVSATLKASSTKPAEATIEEDFEDAFALPADMTRLSLAPQTLHHQSSKSSLEWTGSDKDHTSSSQSSDAYSTLGFADASPSTTTSPDTETDDDCEEEADLDGLVIPSDLFESNTGKRQLSKILAQKKKVVFGTSQPKKGPNAEPEEDFEMGLVIDDDYDLSPSKLMTATNSRHVPQRMQTRSNSAPIQRSSSSLRPPSRLRERAKSPTNPPPSSVRQFQKLSLPPSPPPVTRSQTYQNLTGATPSPSSSNFLSAKATSLRGQKSHTGLKPPSPTNSRRLTRKASLSSLMETSQKEAGPSANPTPIAGSSKARYEEATAASRAKSSHKTSLGHMRGEEYKVPPTRPTTPASNTSALRLTMPTQSTLRRNRPALSSVWGSGANQPSSPVVRTASPAQLLPPRPPSSLSKQQPSSRPQSTVPPLNAARQMKKPKKLKQYGDGTELDDFDDLPTDRDRESRFRVLPKGYGNRVPGGTYANLSKTQSQLDVPKGTLRKKSRQDFFSFVEPSLVAGSFGSSKRLVSSSSSRRSGGPSPKKKTKISSIPPQKKKPTLIRNLGGAGPAKVVGDMKWNPHSLRWEGNETALKDFDAVVTSTRPALITHLTGSSLGSPVGSFAAGARRVGNMIFDPARMCWISTLPPEEDEPDVFANLADDEGDDWDARGDTIRVGRQSVATTENASSTHSNESASMISPSPARSTTSMSDRGSRASLLYDIDDTFVQNCRDSEARHNAEMKGWRSTLSRQDVFGDADRSHLYDVRALATRRY